MKDRLTPGLNHRIAVYPGTFDPITNGHMRIVKRALGIVDFLIVGVALNPAKEPLFSLEQRISMVEGAIQELDHTSQKIVVQPFHSLLVDFVRSVGAKSIIRGLRAVSDFEYEFQMAGMNTSLSPDIETIFLMTTDQCQFISSGLVKEVAKLGGSIETFVPKSVLAHLKNKFSLNGS